MALLVQDDAGTVLLADAYITTAYLETYADNYGIELGEVLDEEPAIRLATQYVDTVRRYRGVRLSGAQLREFPRAGCTDWSGAAAVGVPERVKLATAYLAAQAMAGVALWTDLARGGQVISETVGPISTTYAAGASPHTLFSTEQVLLAQYAYDQTAAEGGLDIDPISTSSPYSRPLFSLGMTDNHQD